MERIDFVITWVDGCDPVWQAERNTFLPEAAGCDGGDHRYRDWELLRYWFRSVEAYAPWVRNVYFVTCGQRPQWLNCDHPRLKIVDHRDFIPEDCLPLFNSNAIELCLHRIGALGERFVLFNDDMFLTAPVTEGDFFRDGLPLETVRLGQLQSADPSDPFPHTVLNNMAVINRHFSKTAFQRSHWRKLLAPCYGRELWRNLLGLPYRHFSAFYDTHLPTSHRKEVFRQVWAAEPELLGRTLRHRFRSREDLTHWLMKAWQICRGEFLPRSHRWGCYFPDAADPRIADAIEQGRFRAICINDGPDTDMEACSRVIRAAFEKRLPEKSAFER